MRIDRSGSADWSRKGKKYQRGGDGVCVGVTLPKPTLTKVEELAAEHQMSRSYALGLLVEEALRARSK